VRRLIFATFYQFNYFNLSVSSGNNKRQPEPPTISAADNTHSAHSHPHTHRDKGAPVGHPGRTPPAPSAPPIILFLLAKMRAICASINALISALPAMLLPFLLLLTCLPCSEPLQTPRFPVRPIVEPLCCLPGIGFGLVWSGPAVEL